MDFKFGCSSKGKPTVIFHNFEYIKDRHNACGTTSWRCRYHQSMKCKARLKTSGNQIICNKQSEHNHSGNEATALAREAVGRMKNSMVEITATPSLVQTTVMSQLNNNVLIALPNRTALSQTLRRHKMKIRAGHNAQNQLTDDLSFAIPETFQDSNKNNEHQSKTPSNNAEIDKIDREKHFDVNKTHVYKYLTVDKWKFVAPEVTALLDSLKINIIDDTVETNSKIIKEEENLEFIKSS